MIDFGFPGQVATQAHRNAACCNFGDACNHYQLGRMNCAAQTGGEGERNSKAITDADYYVAQ